jgi:uncharacterized RDD family membrane protein YckC
MEMGADDPRGAAGIGAANGTHDVYAGFLIRLGGTIIDIILLLAVTWPILFVVYGPPYFISDEGVHGVIDVLLNWVLPSIATLAFWIAKGATPGKMALGVRIVDATDGGRPDAAQFIGRYAASFLSLLVLGLGYFWIAFDARKQGWHDKLAGTVVVRRRRVRHMPA